MLEHITAEDAQTPLIPDLAVASPLTEFVLRGLDSCWMPQKGCWSHIYHLDGRAQPNQSIPESDVFYTLNVLLGLSRIRHLGPIHDYDLHRTFLENVVKVPKLASPKYAYGMALWAAAALDFDIPLRTLSEIQSLVTDQKGWMRFRAQDLGMVLIGCVEQAKRNMPELGPVAKDLFAHLERNYSCESCLFFDEATGIRRRFSSFATNTYLTLACYIYGEWSGNRRALDLANRCARKLISLQGPLGEWPWFFHTPTGRVVDFYEVYSVHQDGMAPAFLEHAEKHGVAGATEAREKGFMWIYGENQLCRSMLWPKEGLICRSQVRKGELADKSKRIIRSIANACTGRGGTLAAPSELQLRLECRSYHLGWVLWSFGNRDDMRAITHHPGLLERHGSESVKTGSILT
jgi:hypothetical protein